MEYDEYFDYYNDNFAIPKKSAVKHKKNKDIIDEVECYDDINSFIELIDIEEAETLITQLKAVQQVKPTTNELIKHKTRLIYQIRSTIDMLVINKRSIRDNAINSYNKLIKHYNIVDENIELCILLLSNSYLIQDITELIESDNCVDISDKRTREALKLLLNQVSYVIIC